MEGGWILAVRLGGIVECNPSPDFHSLFPGVLVAERRYLKEWETSVQSRKDDTS